MSEMEGKTSVDLEGWCFLVFEGWRVGLSFVCIWFCFVFSFLPVLQISKDSLNGRRLCVEAARKGQVLSL